MKRDNAALLPGTAPRQSVNDNQATLEVLVSLSAIQASPAAAPRPGPAIRVPPPRQGPSLVPEARKQRNPRDLARGPWPLLAVLVVQAYLSARLLQANTAFTDEALYLWAGHMEWAHLLHGTPLPSFPTFFSGAPVIYPPIGALADSLGGLAGARALSLVFMLVTTTLLWDSARRLFGGRAAFFAAALFVSLGPVMHLGAFATYDAMALMLLALSAWFVVRSAGHRDGAGWLFAAAAALFLSNATKYATFLFDPVVISMAVLTGFPRPGGKQAIFRATWTAVIAGLLLLGVGELATFGNGYYLTGFEQTTLSRAASTDSVTSVLLSSWRWTWPILIPALLAAIIAVTTGRVKTLRSRWAAVALVCMLAAASLLVPLEQARIHTLTSLDKHVAFGAWFAAIAAGWTISKIISWLPGIKLRAVTTIAGVALLGVPLAAGITQSQILTDWANSEGMVTALRPLAAAHSGRALIDGHSIAGYYLHLSGAGWKRWSSTSSLIMPDGKAIGTTVATAGSAALFTKMIRARYFQVIELNGSDPLDQAIQAAAGRTPGYVLTASGAYGTGSYWIWVLESRVR